MEYRSRGKQPETETTPTEHKGVKRILGHLVSESLYGAPPLKACDRATRVNIDCMTSLVNAIPATLTISFDKFWRLQVHTYT